MALKKTQSYESILSLDPAAQQELLWWRDHLAAWNGRSLLKKKEDLVGWGVTCSGVRETERERERERQRERERERETVR